MAGMVNIATPSYEDYVLSLSPIAYWPFNETSGTVVNDLSESGYHGNIVNGIAGITYSGDILRNGSSGSMGFGINAPTISHASFSNDYTKVSELMGNEGASTICGWFKRTANTTYNIMLATYSHPSRGWSRYRITNNHFESRDNNNRVTVPNYSIGSIYFFAWVKDNELEVAKVYMNGSYYYSSGWSQSTQTATYPLQIPGTGSWDYYPTRGYISDIAMFDYALSDEEIEQMYSLGKIE